MWQVSVKALLQLQPLWLGDKEQPFWFSWCCLHGAAEHSWVCWFPVHKAAHVYICAPTVLCSSTGTCCAPGFVFDFCTILLWNVLWDHSWLDWPWPPVSFAFLPQVKNVFEQEGFSRQKRGYRNINDIEVNMSDPLFTKQWYLVSNQPSSCLHAGPDL